MLSTRKLEVQEVPETWIFEHFAGLSMALNGTELRIHSLFNPKDRTPSMYIFWSERLKKYWFHDFSTGKTGDAIKLVQELFGYTYSDACRKIIKEYMEAKPQELLPPPTLATGKKFKVTDYKLRGWNREDAAFWTSFHIDSFLLKNYGVRPLESYSM
jgi:hypothetical protein